MAPTVKTTVYKMFQLSCQDFVSVQDETSIGTGQSSAFDDPTRIPPIVRYSTIGRNHCPIYVYCNNFKSDSCKTYINELLEKISNTRIRQTQGVISFIISAVVKIKDSNEKNRSAWVKSTDLLADNLQFHSIPTANENDQEMETIGGKLSILNKSLKTTNSGSVLEFSKSRASKHKHKLQTTTLF
jgi:hypothetical protein